ncbi:MAG: recombinase family protein [Chitinophagales bacterium]|nr:recombinase family protein [Hyphomicrobiales bacterium]
MVRKPALIRAHSSGVVRCAIYTRKSSEEGLEQEFNSLDAQREACEAYIRSQKSASWVALSDLYDDGGISGGTMERPALQHLLANIGAGRVDTVVVYKVDRLTRSLSDFAKIVDAFDAKGVSFVSVTQQFNTTTSMGRLTLNMLLSFAQFEREVTGERIRDKIAASKRKGMWMGGNPPLGYDVQDRRLIVNPVEADTVRHIFRRYADLKSVLALKEDLDAVGIVSKARLNRLGNPAGSRSIARGALYLMLQNRIYRGEIVHKDCSYPGVHDAIVEAGLWSEVQAALAENRVERMTRSTASAPSLLTGLVHDDSGKRMSPTHANKRGTRYRYYVSQSLIKRGRTQASDAACRVPAADLETLVEGRLRELLRDESAMLDVVGPATVARRKTMIDNAADLAQRWPTLATPDKRVILHALIARIDVGCSTVDIAIQSAALPEVVKPDRDIRPLPIAPDGREILLSVPARLRRTGMEMRLLIEGARGAEPRRGDRSLQRLIAQARRFSDLVMTSNGRQIKGLAAEAGVSPSYFTRVFRLSFLAPDITKAIIQGRPPSELSAIKLMRAGQFAGMWSDQRRRFGFD